MDRVVDTEEGLLIGAHVSVAGGIDKAVARGEEIGCTAIQVFTRNASRWQSKPLAAAVVDRFRLALEQSPISYVSAHDSYLINLASPDEQLRAKSIAAFIDEMQRCRQLGIPDLVMHPGAIWEEGLKAVCRGWLAVSAQFFRSSGECSRVAGKYRWTGNVSRLAV